MVYFPLNGTIFSKWTACFIKEYLELSEQPRDGGLCKMSKPSSICHSATNLQLTSRCDSLQMFPTRDLSDVYEVGVSLISKDCPFMYRNKLRFKGLVIPKSDRRYHLCIINIILCCIHDSKSMHVYTRVYQLLRGRPDTHRARLNHSYRY